MYRIFTGIFIWKAYFKAQPRHLHGAEENDEELYSGSPVFGSRFETRTSWIRSKRVSH
jgi:hypothetical protein